MKKLMVLAVSLSVLALSACETVKEAVVASLPQVGSPFLEENLGYRPVPNQMSVLNGTPFYASVAVYNETVANLKPGDAVWNTRRWEPLEPQIPIMARFFRDAAMTDYVGAAGRIFQLQNYSPASMSWTIQSWEIRTPSGYPPDPRSLSAIESHPESRGVKFPRQWWNSAACIQVVNNTPYDIVFRGNDGRTRIVKPAQLFYDDYLLADSVGRGGREISLQTVFLGCHGSFIGSAEHSIYVPQQGVYAYQWIVNSSDIQQ